MSIQFDIRSHIEAIPEYIDGTFHNVVMQAARTSIDKSLKSAIKLAVQRVGLSYKLKASGLSKKKLKKMIWHKKARGNQIHTLRGELRFSGKALSLMNFVSGNKDPIKMKGLKKSKDGTFKRRRKLKAEIRPGKKSHIKKAFIQKTTTTAVFKRVSANSKMIRQSVPAIGIVLMREVNKKKLFDHVAKKFPDIFKNQIEFRMLRNNEKLARKRLKVHRGSS